MTALAQEHKHEITELFSNIILNESNIVFNDINFVYNSARGNI